MNGRNLLALTPVADEAVAADGGEDVGGIEASTHQLARRLVGRGHQVAVFARGDGTGGLAARLLARDDGLGYPAYSTDRMPVGLGFALVRRAFRPDVVVVNAGGRWWRRQFECRLWH